MAATMAIFASDFASSTAPRFEMIFLMPDAGEMRLAFGARGLSESMMPVWATLEPTAATATMPANGRMIAAITDAIRRTWTGIVSSEMSGAAMCWNCQVSRLAARSVMSGPR